MATRAKLARIWQCESHFSQKDPWQMSPVWRVSSQIRGVQVANSKNAFLKIPVFAQIAKIWQVLKFAKFACD
jgi:hypothetical protein